MATKHLKLRPHHIDENSWWYEEPEGITVVHNSSREGQEDWASNETLQGVQQTLVF